MQNLIQLFLMFAKIGLFTFGGGYAMFPMLQAEIVKKKRWATEEELLDFYSVGQCTPGVIAVNVATFIGHKQAKIAGAIVATLGMVFPSVIIITLISGILSQFMYNRYVIYAFSGIRICVIALIVNIIYGLWRKKITNYFSTSIFIISLTLLALFNLSAVWIVILAGLAGLLLKERIKV